MTDCDCGINQKRVQGGIHQQILQPGGHFPPGTFVIVPRHQVVLSPPSCSHLSWLNQHPFSIVSNPLGCIHSVVQTVTERMCQVYWIKVPPLNLILIQSNLI